MTRQKNLKRHIRSRMEKTGERYSAARRQMVGTRPQPDGPATVEGPAREPIRPQRTSDEAVRKGTGRTWDEWLALLDEWGGTDHSHGEIARWLVDEHGVSGWWAQSVTVGYEQARGKRQPGQVAGGFAVSASKTVGVPVARLFSAFVDEALRRRWLEEGGLEVRTAQPGKSLRANWRDGDSRVNAGFGAKGDAKSQVQLQHERLPDQQSAERMKAFWRERMNALKSLLEEK